MARVNVSSKQRQQSEVTFINYECVCIWHSSVAVGPLETANDPHRTRCPTHIPILCGECFVREITVIQSHPLPKPTLHLVLTSGNNSCYIRAGYSRTGQQVYAYIDGNNVILPLSALCVKHELAHSRFTPIFISPTSPPSQ